MTPDLNIADPVNVIDAVADAQLPVSFAKELIDARLTPDQVTERIEQKLVEVRTEADRVRDIKALCDAQLFNAASLRDAMIADKTPLATAQNMVRYIRDEVARQLNADRAVTGAPAGKLDADAVYAQRATTTEQS